MGMPLCSWEAPGATGSQRLTDGYSSPFHQLSTVNIKILCRRNSCVRLTLERIGLGSSQRDLLVVVVSEGTNLRGCVWAVLVISTLKWIESVQSASGVPTVVVPQKYSNSGG